MRSFPGSPRLSKSGLLLLDPDSGSVQSVIAVQYNPDSLSRSLQIKVIAAAGDRSELLRSKVRRWKLSRYALAGDDPGIDRPMIFQ